MPTHFCFKLNCNNRERQEEEQQSDYSIDTRQTPTPNISTHKTSWLNSIYY